MTILVALPYWNAEPFIERAACSVLEQTERDLVLLVCGDGQKPPLRIRDSRLVRHAFRTWHGAPFVQQAMLLGSPFPLYAPFGADDWADPDHLALMRSYGRPNVCAGAVWWHYGPDTDPDHVLPADWETGGRRNYEVGCYQTADLRAIGGYGAQERLGQDNLMLHILTRSVGLYVSDRPTYHRIRRPGSLTTMPETGLGSEIRLAIAKRNHRLARHLKARGWLASNPVRHPRSALQLAQIREYREGLVPLSLRAELADCAGEIAGLLQ